MNANPSSVLASLRQIKQHLPKLTGDLLIYGIGGALPQLIAFLVIPFISRSLTITQYGDLNVVTLGASYFLIAMTLNISTGLMRFYHEIEASDRVEQQQLVSTSIWFVLLFGGVVTAIAAVISPILSNQFFGSTRYMSTLQLALVGLWFVGIIDSIKNVLRIQRKPAQYLIISLLTSLLNFGLILLFVVVRPGGLNGYFAAQTWAGFFSVLFGLWTIRAMLKPTFSSRWLKEMLVYTMPMIPGGLFFTGLSSISALMLTQYTTNEQIAYFSMAGKVAKILEFVVIAFTLGWLPVFLQNIHSESFYQKLDRVFRYYVYATLTLSAFLVVFAKEAFLVLGPPEYLAGLSLVGLLCLKQILNGVTYTYTVGITKCKKTYWVSVASGLGVLTTVLVSLWLMPTYGIFGAATADVAGMFVFAAIEWFASNYYTKIRINFLPPLAALGLFVLVNYVVLNAGFENHLLDLLMRIGLFGAFLIGLYAIIDRLSIVNKMLQFFKSRPE